MTDCTPTLVTLPAEILGHICSYLSLDKASVKDLCPERDKYKIVRDQGLVSLCYASQYLRNIGLPFLYQVIHARPKSIAPLTTLLSNRPDLANRVQQVYVCIITVNESLPEEHLEQYRTQLEGNREPARWRRRAPRFQLSKREPLWQAQTFTKDMIPLLLRNTPNVKVLAIRFGNNLGPALSLREEDKWMLEESLTNLKELHIEYPIHRATLPQLSTLLELAPKTSSLSLSGAITAGNIMKECLQGIKSLTLHQSKELQMIDILRECTQLERFTYYKACRLMHLPARQRQRVASFEHTPSAILLALRGHEETLKSLHLETIYPPFRVSSEYNVIFTLKNFTRLEDLVISTSCFTIYSSGGEPQQVTALLGNLPSSIRRLTILKEISSGIINSHLPFLVNARKQGRYPHLEQSRAKTPTYGRDRLARQSEVQRVRRVCRKSDIKFEVVRASDPAYIEEVLTFLDGDRPLVRLMVQQQELVTD